MSMRHPLRILSIEDAPKDAELIQGLLETEGIVCEVTRVDTQAALLASLEQGGINLILADYTLPSFDGISALKLAMKACPEVPFIFVSGTLGEEVAIEALKIGATDYVLKTRLSRLVPSVVRALREARERAEHKQADEKLRRSEAYLTEAQRLSQTGSFGCKLSTGEMYWSEETFRIYGYDQSTTPTVERVLERIHPEDKPSVQEQMDRASREGKACDVACRLLLPDDSVKHVRIVAHEAKNESGIREFIGAVMDITAAKQAEENLRRSEAYLAEGQNISHTGSFGWSDLSGEIYWSEETYNIFGQDRVVKPTLELIFQRIHPDDRDRVRRTLDHAIKEKTHFDIEVRLLMPDGSVNPGTSIRFIHSVGRPILSPSGELLQFVGVAMDVTELKRAEEERQRLRQAETDLAHISRVNLMGHLTASLAHEIKQPIGASVANAEACLQFLDRDQPDVAEAREAALGMAKDARRAAEIIDRVRSLYQKGSSQLETIELNEVIREMLLMLHNQASRYSVTIRTELAEKLPTVMGDRVQLQQVLMNLMLNGIEAMRDTTGELTIKSQLAEGGQLLISVIDTGVGLPAGDADRIFNAFFTTKSQGTGLGLAITRSIIASHGGRIWATANSGRGATLHFTLPNTFAGPLGECTDLRQRANPTLRPQRPMSEPIE